MTFWLCELYPQYRQFVFRPGNFQMLCVCAHTRVCMCVRTCMCVVSLPSRSSTPSWCPRGSEEEQEGWRPAAPPRLPMTEPGEHRAPSQPVLLLFAPDGSTPTGPRFLRRWASLWSP